ncbi:MAG TPA: type II toxin-antitoxin system PemK/MazF family toxin [Candidatus Acidoferrales bacterium]|nr:type II toxin-antitoxin system PemK/MazF family toxin [Candidatus Acidoferrales bacterium]
MKTAVSLPDDLFRRAERLATKSGRSRSKLFAEALDEYLARHAGDEVTEAMNRTLDEIGDAGDGFARAAAHQRPLPRGMDVERRMDVEQGEIWWVESPEPAGSRSGFRRPVVIVQSDALNGSRLGTIVCVPLTSTLKWAAAPGSVLLDTAATGLPNDSVANAAQITSLEKASLTEKSGKLPGAKLKLVLSGVDVVLGR